VAFVEFATILNPPQSGILAVGAAKPQAVVIGGEFAIAMAIHSILSSITVWSTRGRGCGPAFVDRVENA
jgi:hypothetical protein